MHFFFEKENVNLITSFDNPTKPAFDGLKMLFRRQIDVVVMSF